MATIQTKTLKGHSSNPHPIYWRRTGEQMLDKNGGARGMTTRWYTYTCNCGARQLVRAATLDNAVSDLLRGWPIDLKLTLKTLRWCMSNDRISRAGEKRIGAVIDLLLIHSALTGGGS